MKENCHLPQYLPTTALTHFFEMNDITLNWKKLKKFKAKFRTVVEDRPYTRDDYDGPTILM
jgi:hypothetical protein